MLNPSTFRTYVNSTAYLIQEISSDQDCVIFKVFTEEKYLFTLCMDDDGTWHVESDVTPLSQKLVDEIAIAIEDYYENIGVKLQ